MKTNKLLVLGAALLLTATAVGCSGTSSSSSSSSSSEEDTGSKNTYEAAWQIPEGGFDEDKDVTITFYSTQGTALKATFDTYIEKFNEKYPNIHVEHTAVGGYDDVRDQITTELSSRGGPDIAYCYPDHVALYNKTSAVVTLDNLIYDDSEEDTLESGETLGLTRDQKNDFITSFYNEGKSFGDGLMYTLPFSKSTEIMYYNKTVFDEEHLSAPTHWFSTSDTDTTSLEYVCKTLKTKYPDSTPLGYDSSSNWFITMCEQLNSPYTSATGNHFLFNNETNKEFVRNLKEKFIDTGYATTQEIYGTYTSGLFTSTTTTRCFMCIGSSAGASYQVPSKVNEAYPFVVDVASIPQANENNKKVISQGPSLTIFNHGDSQKIIASWLFMKYFTTNVTFQAEWGIQSGYVPVINSVNDNETYKAHVAKADKTDADLKEKITAKAAKLCLEQADYYYTSPAFVGSSTARSQVGNLLTQVFQGKADINTAFADAIASCEASI